MSLRERLSGADIQLKFTGTDQALSKNSYSELKKHIHTCVLDRINFERLREHSQLQIKKEIYDLVAVIVEEEKIALNQHERKNLAQDIEH